jgi:integrase/recombinase XerD
MKTTFSLVNLRPHCFRAWRQLPIFGPILDRFVQWLHDRKYAVATIAIHVQVLTRVIQWLDRRGISSLAQLTQKDLDAVYNYYRRRNATVSWSLSTLQPFLREQELISEGESPPASPVTLEVERFAVHLRDVRGLAPVTVSRRSGQIRSFLEFLRLDRNPSAMRTLKLPRIETYLCRCARTNNRFSLQQIVAGLRLFLQLQHAQGILKHPFHQQIDTPRIYQQEQLPRARTWDQVQALLESIDRSNAFGRRDFTILYLAAAYGLRSGELVRLTLDDLDWRKRTLRIEQTKTKQALQLPMTDEAANVLIAYLRQARPQSQYRQLFLRWRAPERPLRPATVHDVLERRIRHSGLELPPLGTHALRHSLAVHLLRQGATVKTVGDTLGHRDLRSTAIYLRLQVEDLRDVGLPVPRFISGPRFELVSSDAVPPIRPARPSHQLASRFQSWLAASLQRFVDLKQALGRRYQGEISILRLWDDFLHRRYSGARRVQPQMFYDWTQELSGITSTGRRNHLRVVRNFLLFHGRDHAGTFIPDPLSFPKQIPPISPRLVSEAEMACVLDVARQLPASPWNPLRATTLRIGLLLLFCCGLRRGELLRLTLGDLDQQQGLLHVRLTKFHKYRTVPLPPTVQAELKTYLQQRQRKKLPMEAESFLMWNGRPSPQVYGVTALLNVWQRLCVSAQVLNPEGHPPRLHDLRHSMATNALQRWYAQGADVQSKLPYLATYLGHENPVSTHHYLKLTPKLCEAANRKFHQRFASLFSHGGIA